MKEKILIITSGFAPVPAVKGGAVESLTTTLIDQNENMNYYSFTVCTIDDSEIDNCIYKNTKFNRIKVSKYEIVFEKIINKILRIGKIKRTFSIFNHKLLRLLRNSSEKYDYILFENSMDIFERVTKIKKESKYIFHLHNDINNNSKTPKMAKQIADKCDKILFVSEYLKNRFINITNCDIGKCSILYNCIDTDNNRSINSSSKDAMIDRFKIDVNKKVFLYVGRLNEEKGILELTEAFAQLKNENVQLVICGGTWGTEFKSNNYLSNIYKTISQVEKNVIFTQYLDSNEVDILYSIADVVIIPSICNEAFGMVMLEASFHKKPVIATKSGGMYEMIPAYKEYLVENNENIVVNLLYAMNKFLHNENDWIQIAEQANKYIMDTQKFSSKYYLKRFRNIIENEERYSG